MKESGLRIRVDGQLRQDFIAVCKAEDLTASQVLRSFMRQYVDQKLPKIVQTDLFDYRTNSQESNK